MKIIILNMFLFLAFLTPGKASALFIPTEAYTFNVDVSMIMMSKRKENKIYDAVEVIKKVIVSEEFKQAILSHRYNGRKAFADSEGLTNLQIYNKILEGAETLNKAKDNTMNLELQLYTNNKSSVVGYTMSHRPRIWINTKFFNIYTPERVAANLVHEWLHKIGFGHDAVKTKKRKYSVPYAVGYMVKKIGKQLR